MWTTVTWRTPTSTTCARSEHACTLLDVLSSHSRVAPTLAQVVSWVFHLHPHTIHDERFSLSCSTSPFTSPCTSPYSSLPSSPCTPTTLTPWQTTCATPPKGPSSPPTIPSRSHEMGTGNLPKKAQEAVQGLPTSRFFGQGWDLRSGLHADRALQRKALPAQATFLRHPPSFEVSTLALALLLGLRAVLGFRAALATSLTRLLGRQ